MPTYAYEAYATLEDANLRMKTWSKGSHVSHFKRKDWRIIYDEHGCFSAIAEADSKGWAFEVRRLALYPTGIVSNALPENARGNDIRRYPDDFPDDSDDPRWHLALDKYERDMKRVERRIREARVARGSETPLEELERIQNADMCWEFDESPTDVDSDGCECDQCRSTRLFFPNDYEEFGADGDAMWPRGRDFPK